MAFGNYKISFKGRKETLESVFGSEGLKPGEMIKKLWAFIKVQKLSNKKQIRNKRRSGGNGRHKGLKIL